MLCLAAIRTNSFGFIQIVFVSLPFTFTFREGHSHQTHSHTRTHSKLARLFLLLATLATPLLALPLITHLAALLLPLLRLLALRRLLDRLFVRAPLLRRAALLLLLLLPAL